MIYNHAYLHQKVCEVDKNFAKCKQKSSKPQTVLLECGGGTGSWTFTSSDDSPFQLAYVTVDSNGLNRAEVLTKFSSLINIDVLSNFLTVRLQYELFRVCNDSGQISLGTWMYEKVDTTAVYFADTEESFSFISCESQTCHSCCDYFVTVTPVEISGAKVTVSNGRLAALSQFLNDFAEGHKILDSKDKDVGFIKKFPKCREILLECGQGNGDIEFRDSADLPVNIAHVVVDTTCLCRPEVLINFSSTIKFDLGISNVLLQFELFRVCKDGEPVSLGVWRFERTGIVLAHESTQSFGFELCDSQTYPSCYEYFVTVTPLEVEGFISNVFVRVNNGRISALAQSTTDLLYHNDYESIHEKYGCINYQSKHHNPKKILLACGSGTGSRTFTTVSEEAPFQLAHVAIDTTYINKHLVSIDFSSIISFEGITGESGTGRLKYELFRVCDNKEPLSLCVWSIDKGRFDGNTIGRETNTFDFTFCDNVTCLGCCEYFVSVTPIEISGLTVTVDNGRIGALTQER
ncbi:DUF4489 domain-containing protein [Wukongibacter baidiensis]|uniref:DUF4489 domain-containing protein n=1 Tax=Wukongibacter baidiensis TaxID=1723361 RepID=UPI003D7FCFF3